MTPWDTWHISCLCGVKATAAAYVCHCLVSHIAVESNASTNPQPDFGWCLEYKFLLLSQSDDVANAVAWPKLVDHPILFFLPGAGQSLPAPPLGLGGMQGPPHMQAPVAKKPAVPSWVREELAKRGLHADGSKCEHCQPTFAPLYVVAIHARCLVQKNGCSNDNSEAYCGR